MRIYKVSDECIGCHACVEVAQDNFKISDKKAFVKKQPENQKEEQECRQAMEICPVGAIKTESVEVRKDKSPVLASSNVKETLDKYPQLKPVLTGFSEKFNRLLNPVMYNTLARFATFNDAAKVTGVSVCEILHVLNSALGTIEELQRIAPECIKERETVDIMSYSVPITWEESNERYIYNSDTVKEIVEKISKLGENENIVIISVNEPVEIVKTAAGLGFVQNIEKSKEFRVSIHNPKTKSPVTWKERKEHFDKLDVRSMTSDPFDIIIKKAYETKEDDGFTLIQRFEPYPLINMLSEMGFEHHTEAYSNDEYRIYFYKTPDTEDKGSSEKTDVVIQSATPVAYPVIMRLLQSKTVRKAVNIKELKVWEETEKHLAWITSGRADISFSALLTTMKIQRFDVKIPALFVWDNFVLLTRYKAETLKDIIGHDIHTPLFGEAPPTKITKYLIKASGLNPEDFNFVYGEPFGRPEEIYVDFVSGKADTAILREPEASYAIKIMQDRGQEISVISFNEIWNKANPGFGSFPNAGIVFRGEFVRKNPQLVKVVLEELKSAIEWVNANRQEAAKLSFDMMRQPVDRIELFLNRVNFDYLSGEKLVSKIKDYFEVLTKENIVEGGVDDEFYDMFMLE